MIDIDWRPDRSKLRQFGWFSLAGFSLAGMVVAWRFGAFSGSDRWMIPLVLWILALTSGLAGLLAPQVLRPLYLILTALALPIGLVVSNLALAFIFGLFFVPLAIFFRLRGRDELQRNLSPTKNTFWLRCEAPAAAASYYRPF